MADWGAESVAVGILVTGSVALGVHRAGTEAGGLSGEGTAHPRRVVSTAEVATMLTTRPVRWFRATCARRSDS